MPMSRYAILAVLAVAAAALVVGRLCLRDGSDGFRTVARDELSTALDPTYRLIVATEESDLEQLRALLQDQPFKLAAVDFSKEVVLAMAGRMPNRGNPVIKKLTLDHGEVSVQLGGNGGSKSAGQSENSTPFHAVAVRREVVPDPENLRWTAYFEEEEIAGTARFHGRWLPTVKVRTGEGTVYATIAGGYLSESPPAQTTLVIVRDSAQMEGLRQIGGPAAEAWPLDEVDLSTHVIVGVLQGLSGPAYGDRIYIEQVSSIGNAAPTILARWDDADWERNAQDADEGKPARTWAPSYQIVSVPRSFLVAGGLERPWVLLGPRGGIVEAAEANR